MKRNGLAQIPLMIGLLLMAIAVPVATKLVQQNQTNQGKAAGVVCTSSGVDYCYKCCKVSSSVGTGGMCNCIPGEAPIATSKPPTATVRPSTTTAPSCVITSWTDATTCSKTCGGGTKTQKSNCNTYKPGVACNTQACPDECDVLLGKPAGCYCTSNVQCAGKCDKEKRKCLALPTATPTKIPSTCAIAACKLACNSVGKDPKCVGAACTCVPKPTATPTIGGVCCGLNGSYKLANICISPWVKQSTFDKCKVATPTATSTPRPTSAPGIKCCVNNGVYYWKSTALSCSPGTDASLSKCDQSQVGLQCCKSNTSVSYYWKEATLSCSPGSKVANSFCDASQVGCSYKGNFTCSGSCPSGQRCSLGSDSTSCSCKNIVVAPTLTPTSVPVVACVTSGSCLTSGKRCCSGYSKSDTSCTSTSKRCAETPTDEPITTSVVSKCTQCPTTFSCYISGTEYKWYGKGKPMMGFTLVADSKCSNVTKPTFKGKSKGDANCDGYVNVIDYSLWHKEFFDGGKGATVKKTWNADFTGADGKCDGKVSIYDFSLWQKYFNELKGL